ncbi:MAG TPA: MlaD family protein [Anaeromyxobacteraceae bacterium]|nr:MlaD family protein [Anaeromyxobacteraceae bacterium]
METKVSFAIVGAFVVALSAAGVAALLWLSSGRTDRREQDTYLVYFDESVAGLNARAPVKYRGVDVGQVREIDLDTADPNRVRIVLAVRKGVPVKEDTMATLGVQGLTGIAYVDLGGASRESPALAARPGEPFPVIRSGPSLLARLDTATTTLLADLDETILRVREVLDEPTRTALRGTAADLARVTRALARRSTEIDGGIVAAARMMESGARAGAELPALVERLDRAARSVERMADEMGRAGSTAQAAFAEVGTAAKEAGQGAAALRDAVPDLRRLVRDLREATAALGRLAGEMERDPGTLVLGRSQTAPGPGE